MENKADNGGTFFGVTGGRKVTVTGARYLLECTEENILLALPAGTLHIAGKNLKVLDFSEKEGALLAEGDVAGVRFAEKKGKGRFRLFR